MAQYIKTYQLPVSEIVTHDLASLTPMMTNENYIAIRDSIQENGQQVPIIMYRGKLIDGRHRVKALIELGVDNVTAVNEVSTLSESDLRNKVLNVYENRRHQTPTQKSIGAYKTYQAFVASGERVGKGKLAEQMGVSRSVFYRAEKLAKLINADLLDMLYNGDKLNIGTEHHPIFTDNLSTLVNHFETNLDAIKELSEAQPRANDLTDSELAKIQVALDDLQSQFGKRVLSAISSRLYTLTKKDNT